MATGEGRERFTKPYKQMGDILKTLDRDIVLNLCQYGMGDVWEWGGEVGGHCWRTTGDLGMERGPALARVLQHRPVQRAALGICQAGTVERSGLHSHRLGRLGALIESEGTPTSLTANEQYSYMSMWCLMAAPLIFSGDMAKLDEFTLNVLCNAEVIAVDQDALGKQARIVTLDDDTLILAKPLEDGSVAVGLFNLDDLPHTIRATWQELGLDGPVPGTRSVAANRHRQWSMASSKPSCRATA